MKQKSATDAVMFGSWKRKDRQVYRSFHLWRKQVKTQGLRRFSVHAGCSLKPGWAGVLA